MIAEDILVRAGRMVSDTERVRWTDADWLEFVSDGQRQIALMRPDSASVIETIALVPGSRQTIPEIGLRLLDVIRNMGESGQIPGTPISSVKRGMLDSFDRYWHVVPGPMSVRHFAFDDRTPRHFFVYPAIPFEGSVYVEVAYSRTPPECSATTATLALADIYAVPLLEFVLYRAYASEQESTVAEAKAAVHLERFYASLNIKSQVDAAVSPKLPSEAS
ncbi:DUF6682 family protein [Desulfovibrio inopinatus]|uniref:phage adaptor protein n=1 Tax=Desulfovibrio inopinatus TaxID=102109 RepID=UPI000409BD6D|nr:DUF6682 family protein [Desulfovibrio inopinatus]